MVRPDPGRRCEPVVHPGITGLSCSPGHDVVNDVGAIDTGDVSSSDCEAVNRSLRRPDHVRPPGSTHAQS